MKRILRLDLLLISALLGIAALFALTSRADEDSGYPTIAGDLEPLRTAFNGAPGSVRAILLASPT